MTSHRFEVEALVRCVICKQAYERGRPFLLHVAGIHTEYRPHLCRQCDFVSPNAQDMARHAKEKIGHTVFLNDRFDEDKEAIMTYFVDYCINNKKETLASASGARMPDEKSKPSVPIDLLQKQLHHVSLQQIQPLIPETSRRAVNVTAKKKAEDASVVILEQPLPRNRGGVEKDVRSGGGGVQCQHANCSAMVPASCLSKHIQRSHLPESLVKCPVAGCNSAEGVKDIAGIASHLRSHGGVNLLVPEHLADYQRMKTIVQQAVKPLMGVCFPKSARK